MAAIVSSFLETVFDIDILQPSSFVKDNKFCSDLLLDHPLLTQNIWFHCIWKFFFGLYAPKRCFAEFWKGCHGNIVIGNIDNVFQSSQFEFAMKMLPLYNEASLNEYLKELTIKITSKSFLKEYIVAKLCQRYGKRFESSMVHENLIMLYAKFEHLPQPDIELGFNPISRHYVDADSGQTNTTYYDHIYDCVLTDKHFLYKLANNPAIVIETPIESDILREIVKLFPNKPVVINVTDVNYISDTYVFNTKVDFVAYLPSICNHFVCISNKRYPEIKPLAREKRNCIYYLRGWSEHDIVNNFPTTLKNLYDRCVTNIPKKLSNFPLKTYRILDPIQYSPKAPNVDIVKMLVGPSSANHVPETPLSLPQRVETYTEHNKQVHYDTIIDKHKEIPVKRLYQYLVNGARITRDDIVFPTSTLTRMLFTKELFVRIWKDHIRLCCPTSDPKNPLNNTLLFHEFILNYIERKKTIPFKNVAPGKDKTIVLIDNRESPSSVISFLFALMNIQDNEWSCKFLTGNKAYKYYSDILSPHGVEVVSIPEADTENFDIDVYNAILKSKSTWELIGGKHALIIQDDGLLLKKGVEAFMDFDYVGAPWIDAEGNKYIKEYVNPALVGNGGFSLRNVPKSIEIVEKYDKEKHTLFYENQVEIPEDVYFVQGFVLEDANLPSSTKASLFSSEQILNTESIGFHKPWVYHPRENVETFFNAMLA